VRGVVAAAIARPVVTVAVLAAVWVLGRYVAIGMLPASLRGGARHWGALLLCVTFMLASGWLLLRLRPHWLPAPRAPRASLRVTSAVMILGIVLVAFTAAMPYLGLKTRAAFTMFSNVRTEPGHWNHLLIPESVRVFGWQDGEVHFISTDDPELDRKIRALDAGDTVLLGARRIADEFPDATVHYTLDGVERVAAPVSSDPVLGQALSPAQEYFGALRPFVEGGTCQH
jgi:hypothetical protein